VHLLPLVPLTTAYLPAYKCSLDARVENLVPDIKSNTTCRMTVSFQANAGTNFTALSAVRAITLTSNYQHFSFTLDTADYGGASALAFFANSLGYVNAIEFSISADGIANDFVRGPGNRVFLDNLKLEQRTSPPLSVTQHSSGQPVVEWADSATTLQSATNAVGPYTDVTGATSPYAVPAGQNIQFFRTRW
jgi:hypothetical protein